MRLSATWASPMQCGTTPGRQVSNFSPLVGPQSDLPTGAASLPLGTQGNNEYRVDFRDVTVQGHIAVRAAPDHQLFLVCINGAPDKGILLEHGDRLNDFPDTRGSIGCLVVGTVIENAIEI